MELSDLITKLAAKRTPRLDVEFIILERATGHLVCVEITGADTKQLMRVLADRKPAAKR